MEALFFTGSAAWLRSRQALHWALTGHRIAGTTAAPASAPSPAVGVGGLSAGLAPF